MEATIDGIVILRPQATTEHPQNACLDAAYIGKEELLTGRGYTPHIVPRGTEKKELERNPKFHAKRWVVEVLHSFMTEQWKVFEGKRGSSQRGYMVSFKLPNSKKGYRPQRATGIIITRNLAVCKSDVESN